MGIIVFEAFHKVTNLQLISKRLVFSSTLSSSLSSEGNRPIMSNSNAADDKTKQMKTLKPNTVAVQSTDDEIPLPVA